MNNPILKILSTLFALASITAWVLFLFFGFRWSLEVGDMWAMVTWLMMSLLLLLGQIGLMVWEVRNNR